jgi:ubiquinone biosynthesis accessory factor UbiK
MNKMTIEDLASKLADAVPSGVIELRGDMERNFRALLQASINSLNLVSREEFEVQRAVLMKTRLLVEQLEARVNELEEVLRVQSVGNGH